jgi:RNA recognition motif-containing protein
MNVYVGNFPYNTSEEDLRGLFESYGTVNDVSIIKDKYSGESRGFGFVEMASDDEAQAAIDGLGGQEFNGRKLNVNKARPRENKGNRE